MSDRKSFLLRTDPALLEALKRWAGDELRSMNGQIEYLLRDALRRAGRTPGPPGGSTGRSTERSTGRSTERSTGRTIERGPESGGDAGANDSGATSVSSADGEGD